MTGRRVTIPQGGGIGRAGGAPKEGEAPGRGRVTIPQESGIGRAEGARPTLPGRLFSPALEAYRRGLVPAALGGRLSVPYFARTLA